MSSAAFLFDEKYAICANTDSFKPWSENSKASDQSVSDEKVISDAADFVKHENGHVNNSIEKFDKKGLIGLWWDAKGFWNVSNKEFVSKCMKVYNDLNEGILRCIELAVNDDENAYLEIINLYKKIGDYKETADEQAKGKSKALCEVAKIFLDKHMIRNHHLKQVECVVLRTDVKELKETVSELKETAKQGIRNLETVLNENQNFKQQLAKLEKDNADLKKFISDRFPGEF